MISYLSQHFRHYQPEFKDGYQEGVKDAKYEFQRQVKLLRKQIENLEDYVENMEAYRTATSTIEVHYKYKVEEE